MLFALIMGFVASYLYYTIRNAISQYRHKKDAEREAEAVIASRIMLMPEARYRAMFYADCMLCSNDPGGVTDSKLLDFLRKYGTRRHIDIFSLNGISEGCSNLLKMLNVSYTEHPRDEIIRIAENFELPEFRYTKVGDSRLKRFLRVISSPDFGKFAVKYGVILLLLSLITPYKLYYILSGAVLILYAAVLKISRHRVNRKAAH